MHNPGGPDMQDTVRPIVGNLHEASREASSQKGCLSWDLSWLEPGELSQWPGRGGPGWGGGGALQARAACRVCSLQPRWHQEEGPSQAGKTPGASFGLFPKNTRRPLMA